MARKALWNIPIGVITKPENPKPIWNGSEEPKEIGSGSAFTVIRPAPYNINNGKHINCSGKVCRITKYKERFNKTIKRSKNLSGFIPEEIPYKRKFKAKNFPTIFRFENPNTEVHMSYMNNLGLTFHQVANPYFGPYRNSDPNRNSEIIKKLNHIPVETYIMEILKLFKQFKYFEDIGLRHGDLHAANILINPENGIITLIDYDNSYYVEKGTDNKNEFNKLKDLLYPLFGYLINGQEYKDFNNFMQNKIFSPIMYEEIMRNRGMTSEERKRQRAIQEAPNSIRKRQMTIEETIYLLETFIKKHYPHIPIQSTNISVQAKPTQTVELKGGYKMKCKYTKKRRN